jgi:leucyl-tRNA synthetase
MGGKAMSKSLGNLVNLQEQIAEQGPDAVRVTMLFAGPPEEDIDWADLSPTGSGKWLARVWRLCGDVAADSRGVSPEQGDLELRKQVHRLVDETTHLMQGKRLNVAIARLMQLTSALRKAVDAGPGPSDPAVREGAEALARMLSCVAPFTAEDAWERLGNTASVIEHGWPEADPALVAQDLVTCVVQVAGKVRDRIEVSSSAGEDELRALALASAKVRDALGGAEVARLIVRPPSLVNIVPAKAKV